MKKLILIIAAAITMALAIPAVASASSVTWGINLAGNKPVLGLDWLQSFNAHPSFDRQFFNPNELNATSGCPYPCFQTIDTMVQEDAENGMVTWPVLMPKPVGTQAGDNAEAAGDDLSADESGIVTFASQIVGRYGVNGTFWSQNPSVPFKPMTSFEIGNEINTVPVIGSNGYPWEYNYSNPIDYATLFQWARSEIHNLQSFSQVVNGGFLVDGPGNGTCCTVGSVESYLGGIFQTEHNENWPYLDQIGYHVYDYTYGTDDPSTAEADLLNFEQYSSRDLASLSGQIDQIDITEGEFGDFCNANCNEPGIIQPFSNWLVSQDANNGGLFNVFEPYWWGGTPGSATNGTPHFVNSDGSITGYGQSYLEEVACNGCLP